MAEERTQAQMFEAISRVVDGDTPEEGCRKLLDAMEDCHPCRQFLASLAATQKALEASGHEQEIPADEVDRLLVECRVALQAKCPDLFGGKTPR